MLAAKVYAEYLDHNAEIEEQEAITSV